MGTPVDETFAHAVSRAPRAPGVYRILGSGKVLLYVGKAKDLRSRLRSYLNPAGSGLGPRKSRMVAEARDVTWIVTGSELEAFVLEANLIKSNKPRYNIILRDDKAYPYLRLTVNEPWPRLEVVRRQARDGALYFGPYVPVQGMREILRVIRRAFPIRLCRRPVEKIERPCLQRQMGRCLGPCAGDVPARQYGAVVEDVRAFLEGKDTRLLQDLRRRMWNASAEEDYERAAELRDRIAAIERVWEGQRAVSGSVGDADVFGLALAERRIGACILFVRAGRVIGSREWTRARNIEDDQDELAKSLLVQYYARDVLAPDEIVAPNAFADRDLLARWLSDRRGRRVRVSVSVRGVRRELRNMAEENAYQALVRRASGSAEVQGALEEVRKLLRLKSAVEDIHGFDISTHAGSESVGSRVAWSDGAFDTAAYRRFRIRSVSGMNDVAMMEEVVARSYRKEEPPGLVLVDGGRGQLSAALRALRWLGKGSGTAVAALAKERGSRDERLYVPDSTRPIPLPKDRPGGKLLMSVRDEAHRFAVTLQRKRQRRRTVASPLSEIRGIGPRRRNALLRAFGSLAGIRSASIEELTALPGITREIARAVHAALEKST